jgi:hypothetical protein
MDAVLVGGCVPEALNKGDVEWWLKNRIGYGNLDGARIWFLGLEEHCSSEEELPLRIQAREMVSDLPTYHRELAKRMRAKGLINASEEIEKLFQDKYSILQPTWGKLLCCLWGFKNLPFEDKTSRQAYQASEWGSLNGEALVAEIWPLPAPNTKAWPCCYSNSGIDGLHNRRAYERLLSSIGRFALLRKLIEKHKPKLVVAYGNQFWTQYPLLSLTRKTEELPLKGTLKAWRLETETPIIVTRHPVRGPSGKEWYELGKCLREMLGDT